MLGWQTQERLMFRISSHSMDSQDGYADGRLGRQPSEEQTVSMYFEGPMSEHLVNPSWKK